MRRLWVILSWEFPSGPWLAGVLTLFPAMDVSAAIVELPSNVWDFDRASSGAADSQSGEAAPPSGRRT